VVLGIRLRRLVSAINDPSVTAQKRRFETLNRRIWKIQRGLRGYTLTGLQVHGCTQGWIKTNDKGEVAVASAKMAVNRPSRSSRRPRRSIL